MLSCVLWWLIKPILALNCLLQTEVVSSENDASYDDPLALSSRALNILAWLRSHLFPFWCGEATVKILKFRTPEICCNHPKGWTKWRFLRIIHPRDAEAIANSVDPDLGAVWSGSALFALTCLSENFRYFARSGAVYSQCSSVMLELLRVSFGSFGHIGSVAFSHLVLHRRFSLLAAHQAFC